MTDAEIIQRVRAHFESLFPKTCPHCGRRYRDLRDYIENTQRTGPTISYDAELRDWKPAQPIGAIAAANCACGTTIALSTEGMALAQIHDVLEWVQVETARRGVSVQELLGGVRDEIRRQVLAIPNGQPRGDRRFG